MFKKIVNKLYKVFQTRLDKHIEQLNYEKYIKKIRSSYNHLSIKKKLSTQQIREIQDYYKKAIGHEVPVEWHQYFYSRTGNYSKLYIPTIEYKTHLIGRLNVYPLHLAYNDKNMTDVTLPNTHQPKIFLKNMAGYFYVNGKAITKDEALALCKDLGDVIIKPSLTGRGTGVKKVHISDGKVDGKQTLEELLNEYHADYLVQAVIHQHKGMEALNPSSINTPGGVMLRYI